MCNIGITLAVSLGRCLNTWYSVLMFKELHWDLANVNALKTYDFYIINDSGDTYLLTKEV